jgi:hypothetical protein
LTHRSDRAGALAAEATRIRRPTEVSLRQARVRVALIALVVAGCGRTVGESLNAESGAPYFPSQLTTDTTGLAAPLYYAEVLRQLGEPSLHADASDSDTVARLLVFPLLGVPTVTRYAKPGDDWEKTFVVLDGHGGYMTTYRGVARREVSPVTAAAVQRRIDELLAIVRGRPAVAGAKGLDGTYHVLELRVGPEYWVLERWDAAADPELMRVLEEF